MLSSEMLAVEAAPALIDSMNATAAMATRMSEIAKNPVVKLSLA